MGQTKKLDVAAERKIVQLRAGGLDVPALAERFAVNPKMIRRVLGKYLPPDEPESVEEGRAKSRTRLRSGSKGENE